VRSIYRRFNFCGCPSCEDRDIEKEAGLRVVSAANRSRYRRDRAHSIVIASSWRDPFRQSKGIPAPHKAVQGCTRLHEAADLLAKLSISWKRTATTFISSSRYQVQHLQLSSTLLRAPQIPTCRPQWSSESVSPVSARNVNPSTTLCSRKENQVATRSPWKSWARTTPSRRYHSPRPIHRSSWRTARDTYPRNKRMCS
jgi:hypothetical protein